MSISVDSNNLSFVNDLNPGKDMWNMKARIIRKWNQGYKMDLIFIDEKGAKIQAGIKTRLIPVFDGQLQEDDVVILSKFGVDWQGVEYGFNFRAYEDILQGEALNALSVDVAGSVIYCGDLEIFDRPPKQTKKMNFDIEDLEGKVLRCTMWNDYALQIKDFISKIPPHEHVMAVIQHGKCKEWKCEYTVQSDKLATRFFLNEEIDEVNELRRWLILKFGQGSGSTSQTILSSQNVFPLHKEFVTDGVKKHVDEISEIEKEMSCVVVATIKIVQEEHGWFYAAFFKCFKKVMGKSEYLQNVENVLDDIVRLPATSLVCPKCHSECTSITTKFKVQVRVQDESGSVSFVMFDRDVQKLLGLAASDIRERQVTQEVADVKDVTLLESSQVSDERTSRDAVSVTADSSAVEVEKDSISSPNGKRMAQNADVVNVGELSTNVRRTQKKLTKLNN
ncbi:replication protein A 70 kDa DNA-binding subunit A-like [Helianthus annuus]|uniref:replication protein A 70 kDa DNA-binding subunit A-like n=1 Tax=Helianthus annuus TaxID=4232 RepID=UPI000B8EFEC9|nr:replication protein A 70 kDa DNA-binding subunit A-like [Helianthus annuus]